MKELIDYLNQSGLTDLVRIYMIIGGILFLAVFFLAIWIIVRVSRRVFDNRKTSMLDFKRRREERKKKFNT